MSKVEEGMREWHDVAVLLDDGKVALAGGEVWNYDPAASGPRRRLFVTGTPYELIVWEDGEWCVFDNAEIDRRSGGRAPSLAIGKERAIAALALVMQLATLEKMK